MGAEAPQQVYTRQHVLRLLDITERQLSAWEREKLIPTGDSFTFSDLIVLRTLAQLRESGIPSHQIRRAVESIRERIHEVRDPLAELKIVSDGKRIRVLIAGQTMEPFSGQLILDFDRAELSKLVHFPPAPAQGESIRQQQRQRAEAELLFQQAVQMEQTGAPIEDIVAAYEEAARLDPTSSGALVNLGTLYFNARKWRDAERSYKKALEVTPDYALAHFNLGNLYDERGERSKALLHYQRAVTLRPTYADAHYNLALLFQTVGQPLQAVSHWQTFLRLDGLSSWAQIARRELDKLRRAMVVGGTGR
jgi:tetratricopeptide (TPR) repeat protein